MTALATRVLRDPFFSTFGIMDELLNRMLGNGSGQRTWMPAVDVRELDEHYLVTVDLPGVDPDSVSIEVEGDVLTISGERPHVEDGQAYRLERPSGPFVRSLALPKGCDVDNVVADYRNGVVEIRIPKPAEQRPKKIALTTGEKKAITEKIAA
ncbi:MAG TPA: Hsp20/alpha crystallin family protein [Gaiellaceae bacterium]|jgi:HSP20 family protein|nr:Hsp20/alpha crystallin family protein [Gaiellaceae bacterium]